MVEYCVYTNQSENTATKLRHLALKDEFLKIIGQIESRQKKLHCGGSDFGRGKAISVCFEANH